MTRRNGTPGARRPGRHAWAERRQRGDRPVGAPGALRPGRRAWGGLCLLLAVGAGACAREVERVPEVYRPSNAHEAYMHGLNEANLTNSAMARDWIAASEAALLAPVRIASPFVESGYFDQASATAVGYLFDLRRGQKVEAEVRIETPAPVDIFMDVFRRLGDGPEGAVHIASGSGPGAPSGTGTATPNATDTATPSATDTAAPGATDTAAPGATDTAAPGATEQVRRLSLEPLRDGVYVLRVQPELLRSVRYTVSVITDASLAFPVAGHSTGAIQSFFGADRDGGRRSHRGVDIFAPRGTPVFAASDGVVTRANTTAVGGNVVWIGDDNRNLRLYYAHLDSHSVQRGQRVKAGDQLGTVGNTGNAVTTPPHLHFGVYARGAVDPFPFLERHDTGAPDIVGDVDRLGAWSRVRIDAEDLLAGPFDRAAVLTTLDRHTPVLVRGASAQWYRVSLPDGTSGYVATAATEPVAPLHSQALAGRSRVFDRPAADGAIIDEVAAGSEVPVLGVFGEFLFVEAPRGRGWLLSN